MAIYVYSGQVSSGITLNNDSMYVYYSGTAIDTTVSSGGVLNVSYGGMANSTTVKASGGMHIFRGTATSNTVSSGGYLGIGEWGSADDNLIDGGTLHVYNGTAARTTLNFGAMNVFSGGTAKSTTVNGYGAYLSVSSGGTVTDTLLNDNCHIYISSGGSATNTTLRNNGRIFVSNGGIATSNTANYDGMIYVSNGGIAIGNTINYYGLMWVYSGGTGNSTTVNGSGILSIHSDGTGNSITVNERGELYLSTGGKVTGSLEIASGAVVSAYEGSIIDFDISTRNADSPALVNDLSLISGIPNYTITVSTYKEPGVYTLAHGAEGFTGTFTIGTDGSNYGTVTVNGAALSYGDYAYTLATADSDLLLTVAKPVDPYIVSGMVLIDYSYHVSSGYTVLDTQVNSGGILNVLDGGTANDTILNSSGFMYVSPGGTASGVIINGIPQNYFDGYSLTPMSMQLNYDGLCVSRGGMVSDVIINSGKMVNNGGTVRNVTLESGMYVIASDENAVTENITANEAGEIVVFCETGRISGMTLNSGGIFVFTPNWNGGFQFDGMGTITNITVNRGGILNGFTFEEETVQIEDMAHISHALVASSLYTNPYFGTTAVVFKNQLVTDITIENGGSLWVCGGGKAEDVTVESGGSLYVENGEATNITVEADGKFNGFTFNESAVIADAAHMQFNHVTVESEEFGIPFGIARIFRNQTATDVTVESGGSLDVETGGAADNITVKSGGDLQVREGATAANITVEVGGTINGFSFADTVHFDDVFSCLSNAIVNGWSGVYAGQTVTDATVYGNMYVYDGGTADNITVKSEGNLSISADAQVSNITVEAGGVINGFRLAESAVIEDAAHLHLSDLTVDAYSFSSFYASVYAGQTVTNVTDDFYMYVYSGGTATDVTIGDYSRMTVNGGGTADHITVKSGAGLEVLEGAAATNITIEAGGQINGFSFADTVLIADWSEFSVSNAFVNDWWAVVYAGQTVTDVTVTGGMLVEDGGTAKNIAVNEYGSLDVDDGGTAANVTVRNNGSLTVYDGANVSAVTVEAGGEINGFTFGEETVTFENEFHFSNAQIKQYRAYVYRNQTASDITVNGTTLSVSDGGYASDITVNAGGLLSLEGNGSVSDVTVNSGGKLHVSSGGKVTGSLEIASGAVVSADEGSIIDFDISDRAADSPALVNDLSLISGTPNYTITVSADQAFGAYTLASGAAGFNCALSIGTDGSNYGTATVNGAALTYGDYAYTLTTADSDLLLTVSEAGPVDPYVVSGLVLVDSSYNVPSGYTALDTQVNSGGILNVLDGGTANDTILNSRGFIDVSAGGTAHGIIINGTNDYSYPTWYCYQDGLTVFAGGQVSDVTLNSGRMVNDGGTVRNVTVESGLFTIDGYSDTALTENITVNDGGIISFFMNPGRVNGVTVNSGGAVSYATLANGGFRFDGPGSVANITVNCGGKFMGFSFSGESVLIEDMARISNAIVSAGDFASVIRNQIADGISIENGGSLSVWDGAKAVDVTVKSGGSLDISTGGKFANITLEAGGKFSGFTFNESAVIADPAHVQFNHVSVESEEYETAILSRNQTATDVTVQSGGSLDVENGGIADNVTVKSGGDLRVLEGAAATNITVEAGGKINGFSLAESASIADISNYDFSDLNLSVERYNHAFVNAGQSVKNIAVDGGLSVNNGGSAENITVNRGYSFRGTMEVGKGGTADHITIKSDSFLDIAEGAVATNITVEAGGQINGFKLAESVVIEDAAHFHLSNLTLYYSEASVYAGQTVTNVAADFYMYVYSGGTAIDVTVGGSYNSWMRVYSGGTADRITVKSGANLEVLEGAAATNITVEAGGQINGFSFADTVLIADWSEFSVSNAFVNDWWAVVYAGQTVTDVTVNGGMAVDDGGTAENIAVNEYGSLVVYDGGTAANVTVRNNGSLTVYDGADVSAVTVEAGGRINGFTFGEETVTFENEFHFANAQISESYAYVHRNQTASDITVSGTTLYVSDGGYASDITVKDAGVLRLQGDGAAADVTVKSGGKLEIKDAASATHITVEVGGSINGFTFGDGTVVIEDASVLSGLTVSSDVQVSGFQTVTDLTVEPGGSINGFIFGTETMAVENASQLSGVTVKSDAYVYENQSVTNVNVGVGGRINGFSFWSEDPVEDASRLSDVYISSNDYAAYVYSGQTVTNITNFGYDSRLFVYSGGKIGGTLSFGNGLWVQVDAGGIVDFTVAGRTAGGDCLVDDLSKIEVSPTYTITVAADQAEGTYRLANGANGFSEIVTICMEGGGSDSITVGETVTLDGRDYTLSLDSSLLTLTVSGGAPVVSGTAGDLNMDGRADIVMSIDQGGHPADGSTGAWLILDDQTAAWGDLSTRNAGWEIFGTGKTAADKNTDDVYIRSSDNVIGAWTTADDGKVNGWETVGEFDSATQIVGLGDFNADGQTDLLLRNTNGAVGCFFTSEEKHGWNYFQSLGDEWKLSAVGDLNGDGRDDVVLKHDAGFAGSWLTQADGTMAWADLDTLPYGFEIVGAGDFNADGTDDVLLKNGSYYGAWLVNNGNAAGWMGLGDLGDVTVEQIADFNGDGVDDLRIRTAAGDLGAQLVMGEDTLDWHYYGSVGAEWKTGLAALS